MFWYSILTTVIAFTHLRSSTTDTHTHTHTHTHTLTHSHSVDEFEHVFELDIFQPKSLQLLSLAVQQSLAHLQRLAQRLDLLLRVC